MRALTDKQEHAILQSYCKGGTVLEIGSYDGASALAMAKVAKAVYCIDPFLEDERGTHGQVFPSAFQFLKNTAHQEAVHLLHGRSVDFLPLLASRSFDLVFVDGSHSYEACSVDLAHAVRLGKPRGFVAVHDCEWPNVAHACQERLSAVVATEVQEYAGRLAVWRLNA